MNDSDENISFSDALTALQDVSAPFPVRYLRSFSDLSPVNLKNLMRLWPSIPIERKVGLLEDLESVMEKDTLVNFDNLARTLLADAEPAVRTPALRLLWECEEQTIIPNLIEISVKDEDETARATAISLLGKFILLGELDALKDSTKELLTGHLVNIVLGSEKSLVKQRALESLGYSSHPDVPELIRNAFQSNDTRWITAALCAMGRSADETWAPQVETMLTSPEPEIQFEAIRAAGELELSSAREQLLSLLEEETEDDEIRLALIWSLSQIGGEEVKEKLDELLKNPFSDDEAEWIEKAMENLDISSSGDLNLLDFSPENEEDGDDEVSFDEFELDDFDDEDDEEDEDQ